MRPLDVDGISGEDVKTFLISRDGSRLIAVIRQNAEEDSIVVSRIVTSDDGKLVSALSAPNVTDPADLDGRIRDIAWRSQTSIAVLQPIARELFQIRPASVDGASLRGPPGDHPRAGHRPDRDRRSRASRSTPSPRRTPGPDWRTWPALVESGSTSMPGLTMLAYVG